MINNACVKFTVKLFPFWEDSVKLKKVDAIEALCYFNYIFSLQLKR